MKFNIADLPAVRSQLERDAAMARGEVAAGESPGAHAVTPSAPVEVNVAQVRPVRNMVLSRGRYYVAEDDK